MKCIENSAKKSATNSRSAVFSHLCGILHKLPGQSGGSAIIV